MGIPIISTKKELKVLIAKNNKNILICNNEIEFSNSIKKILKVMQFYLIN